MVEKEQLDSHKLMYHVHELSRWLNNEIFAPIYIEIGPINSCNHRCSFCALDYLKSKGKMINKDILISTFQDMAQFGVKSIMFGGEGEPLLYPYIVEVTEKAKSFGLDIAVTTNGVLFSPALAQKMLPNISWIKFSIDAGTKESYAKIHGCKEEDFLILLENLRFAGDYKKTNNLQCKIGCQMLLIDANITEIESLILKIKDLGLDYLVLKPYSQHPHSINQQKIELDKFDAALRDISKKYSSGGFSVIYRKSSSEEISKKEIAYDICHGLDFFALIDALGNVIPCNIFYEKEDYTYGNINDTKFSDIWKSERRKAVVNKLYQEGCSKCRKGCRLNFVNNYLHHVKYRDIEHINFI